MSLNKKITRREFIEKGAFGTAGMALASTLGASALRASSNPSDIVGVGLIGVGTKGSRHLKELLKIPGVQVRGICDAFTGFMERALNIVNTTNVKSYTDYRKLLDNKDIDAVIIATPDHLHAKMTCDAAEAGKDVYVEKCMTRTIPEAKAVVKAIKKNKRILQLGHQGRSNPLHWRAKEIVESGILGKINVVRITMYRNSSEPAWRFFGDYSNFDMPPNSDPQHIDWQKFLGNAPKRPFNVKRFFHWRCYWDYGTGMAGDLGSHKFDDANLILNLGIPKTSVASGGIYYWKDDREVPDVWHVLYEYPDKDVSVVFGTMFSNSYYGETVQLMGKNGTIDIGRHGLRIFLEPYTDRNREILNKLMKQKREEGEKTISSIDIPVYTYPGNSDLYYRSIQTRHMQNFIDCVRTRQRTRCNEDDGFEEAVTCIMSVIAYKEKREVRWDPVRQEVV